MHRAIKLPPELLLNECFYNKSFYRVKIYMENGMNSSHGHIIAWMKLVAFELVARHNYKPSISKSFFLVPPTPRGVYCLCVWSLSYLSSFLCGWLWVWGFVCPLHWLAWTVADVFSAVMQKLRLSLKLFILWFHLCSFYSLAPWPQSQWLTEDEMRNGR